MQANLATRFQVMSGVRILDWPLGDHIIASRRCTSSWESLGETAGGMVDDETLVTEGDELPKCRLCKGGGKRVVNVVVEVERLWRFAAACVGLEWGCVSVRL